MVQWQKQSDAALRAFVDEQDQLVDTKLQNSDSSHYALQEEWSAVKEGKDCSESSVFSQDLCNRNQKHKWDLDAPRTREFHQVEDETTLEDPDKK